MIGVKSEQIISETLKKFIGNDSGLKYEVDSENAFSFDDVKSEEEAKRIIKKWEKFKKTGDGIILNNFDIKIKPHTEGWGISACGSLPKKKINPENMLSVFEIISAFIIVVILFIIWQTFFT